jgi:hypothetical protein
MIIANATNTTKNFFISFSFPNTGGTAVSGGTLKHIRQLGFTGHASARLSMEFSEGLRVEEQSG